MLVGGMDKKLAGHRCCFLHAFECMKTTHLAGKVLDHEVEEKIIRIPLLIS